MLLSVTVEWFASPADEERSADAEEDEMGWKTWLE